MCCSWQNRFHKEQQKSEGLPSTNPRKMPRPDPMILAKTTASPRNGLDGCIQIIIGLFPSHIVHLAVTIEWKPLEMSYLFWAIWKKCISTFPKVPIHSCTHFQRSESASTLVSSFVHISFFKLMMSSVRFSSFSCICCKVFDTSSIQLSWFFKASWMSPISSLAVGWLKQWFPQRNRINQIFELCNCSTWRTYPPCLMVEISAVIVASTRWRLVIMEWVASTRARILEEKERKGKMESPTILNTCRWLPTFQHQSCFLETFWLFDLWINSATFRSSSLGTHPDQRSRHPWLLWNLPCPEWKRTQTWCLVIPCCFENKMFSELLLECLEWIIFGLPIRSAHWKMLVKSRDATDALSLEASNGRISVKFLSRRPRQCGECGSLRLWLTTHQPLVNMSFWKAQPSKGLSCTTCFADL